jgi:RsiW-degrading membrane proteinase PrsW (M82 family)
MDRASGVAFMHDPSHEDVADTMLSGAATTPPPAPIKNTEWSVRSLAWLLSLLIASVFFVVGFWARRRRTWHGRKDTGQLRVLDARLDQGG